MSVIAELVSDGLEPERPRINHDIIDGLEQIEREQDSMTGSVIRDIERNLTQVERRLQTLEQRIVAPINTNLQRVNDLMGIVQNEVRQGLNVNAETILSRMPEMQQTFGVPNDAIQGQASGGNFGSTSFGGETLAADSEEQTEEGSEQESSQESPMSFPFGIQPEQASPIEVPIDESQYLIPSQTTPEIIEPVVSQPIIEATPTVLQPSTIQTQPTSQSYVDNCCVAIVQALRELRLSNEQQTQVLTQVFQTLQGQGEGQGQATSAQVSSRPSQPVVTPIQPAGVSPVVSQGLSDVKEAKDTIDLDVVCADELSEAVEYPGCSIQTQEDLWKAQVRALENRGIDHELMSISMALFSSAPVAVADTPLLQGEE